MPSELTFLTKLRYHPIDETPEAKTFCTKLLMSCRRCVINSNPTTIKTKNESIEILKEIRNGEGQMNDNEIRLLNGISDEKSIAFVKEQDIVKNNKPKEKKILSMIQTKAKNVILKKNKKKNNILKADAKLKVDIFNVDNVTKINSYNLVMTLAQ